MVIQILTPCKLSDKQMSIVTLVRKTCLTVAALWAVFMIAASVAVTLNPDSVILDGFVPWEGIVFGILPLIYVYLIFHHIVPHLIEIHESNQEDEKDSV